MIVERLMDKYKEQITEKVIELNDSFMGELRKMDLEIGDDLGINMRVAATIAFSSLALLAGHLLARNTVSAGSKEGDILVKKFYDQVKRFYNEALAGYSDQMKDLSDETDRTFH